MSEILTDKGQSIGAGTNWIITIIVGSLTGDIINAFGGGDLGSGRLFVLCGIFTFIGGLFFLFILKETRGLSEIEVSQLYCNDKVRRSDINGSVAALIQLDETKDEE